MAKYEVVTTVTTIEGEKPRVGKFENHLSKFRDRGSGNGSREYVKIQLRTLMLCMGDCVVVCCDVGGEFFAVLLMGRGG